MHIVTADFRQLRERPEITSVGKCIPMGLTGKRQDIAHMDVAEGELILLKDGTLQAEGYLQLVIEFSEENFLRYGIEFAKDSFWYGVITGTIQEVSK